MKGLCIKREIISIIYAVILYLQIFMDTCCKYNEIEKSSEENKKKWLKKLGTDLPWTDKSKGT